MASNSVSLIQDQNINVHCNDASVVRKAQISKVPRKASIGGRKPLGEISNSMNPTPNQTSKKENFKVLSSIEKEIDAFKLTNDSSKKRSVSKALQKVQTGGRKALSDISNSGKPWMQQETSKKSQSANLTILAEDPSEPNDISKEGFLHNHEEYMKAQKRAISMNEFFRILQLDDFCKQSVSTKEPPISKKLMHMSPPRYFEPRETTELLIEDLSPPKHKMSRKMDSAPPSPEAEDDHYMHWNDPKYIPSFKLIESPY